MARVIVAGGSHSVIEFMARHLHPQDAGREAVRRGLEMNHAPRLWTASGEPRFNVHFYAVDVHGRAGSAAIYPGRFALVDRIGARVADCAFLRERK